MKFLRLNLNEDRSNENNAKYCRADEVTGAFRRGCSFAKPRHGDGIATGLAQSGREDLNDPEEKRYLWYFCNKLGFPFVHFSPPYLMVACSANVICGTPPKTFVKLCT